MHYLNFSVDQQDQHQQPNTENVNEEVGPSDDWEPVMHVRENGPNPTDMAAYNAIYKKLLEVQKVDKKRWHHRPVYRVSAILLVIQCAKADPFHIFYSKLGCNIIFMAAVSKLYSL